MKKKSSPWLNYLVLIGLSIGLVFFYVISFPLSTFPKTSVSSPASTELRGVWLTNVASGVLYVPWGVNRCIKQLSQLNFNTVYPVVWNRGHTFYRSQLAKQVIGREQEPLLKWMRWRFNDVLAEIVKQSKKEGLRVIPWFEYGLIVPKNSELAKRHPDWLTEKQNSDKTLSVKEPEAETVNVRIPQTWLNPFRPEVQNFIKELILEVVTNYDVDGIQLDDHFGMPTEMGYDPFTIKLYQQEHRGINPPDNPFDPEWMRWRSQKITNLISQIRQGVKKIKPNVKISLSPNSQYFSYTYYLQDWQTWVEKGLIDELVLQVYRDDLSLFRAELSQGAVKTARRRIPVSVAIFTGNFSHPVEIAQIKKQVETVRKSGFNGVSFFYWESLWGYLTPESPKQRRKVFREFF